MDFGVSFPRFLLGIALLVLTIALAQAVFLQDAVAANPQVPEHFKNDPDLRNPVPATVVRTEALAEATVEAARRKTPYELYLTGLTVALGLLMGAMVCLLAWRAPVHSEILKAYLLVMIVFAALFLIVAGYSENQTAPVFGLLGTILGYMFGRTSEASTSKSDDGSL